MVRKILALVPLLIFVFLAKPAFAQQSHDQGGNVYLFANYFDDLDLDNFNPDEEPEFEAYLLLVKSFSIDLEKEVLLVDLEAITRLPLPSSPITLEPHGLVQIDFSTTWHTILYVESVSIMDLNNFTIRREIYTTVFGMVINSPSGDDSYRLIRPRTKLQ